MNLREVTMKYDFLVVFIRHDSAEILEFWYRLTLGIGTPKIMASTGVFVRVVFALKRPISSFSSSSSMILTYLSHRKSHNHQKMGPNRDIYERRQRTKETDANREKWKIS
jgi:ABC-type sulfate/molybdate transport systems ATPase subunit